MIYQKALFIFRRDLRLEDNTGLIFALKSAKEVVPCFIFTPTQIHKNPYLGKNSLQFLIESLEDLQKQLEFKKGQLFLFYGEVEDVIEKCINQLKIDAVIVNRDYTPYSLKRDQTIQNLCTSKKIHFQSFDDALLQPPENTLKKDGKPYTVFTPYYLNSCKIEVENPKKNLCSNYSQQKIAFALTPKFFDEILPTRELAHAGGRTKAIQILKNDSGHLSAHLKFTTCSPREVYYAIPRLRRSLYWRDFFSSIAFYFPQVFKGNFRNQFKWNSDVKPFYKWCEGKTGFPIVDAAMRELNQTGFMDNRMRMIVASFLVKDLHIDWRWGEKYFAQKLADYDPAINNGNWQWVAGTGCDAQPYFRVFNPWTQAKKFDPDCQYIKKWVPELAEVPFKRIHTWDQETEPFNSYPPPMVDHSKEAVKWRKS